jgi:hypothetical protein
LRGRCIHSDQLCTFRRMNERELAIDLVNTWVGTETLGGDDGDQEEYELAVEHYIDLTAFDHSGLGLPEEVESNELRSSLFLSTISTRPFTTGDWKTTTSESRGMP